MGLYDDAVAESARLRLSTSGPCLFGEYLKALKKPDRADLRRALRNPVVSSSAILKIVRDRGYTGASATVIKKHRRPPQCPRCLADGDRGAYGEE